LAARRFRAEVFLANMEARVRQLQGYFQMIIYNEWHTMSLGQRQDGLGEGEHGGGGSPFGANLEQARSSFEEGTAFGVPIPFADIVRIQDTVESTSWASHGRNGQFSGDRP
jgi:hypothetical protein